jgi:hypothetical protein
MRASYLQGINDSGLVTRYSRDPIMGGTGMRGNFVTVEKVDGGGGHADGHASRMDHDTTPSEEVV